MFIKTLTAAAVATALLIPVANAATPATQPAGVHVTKVAKPHKTVASSDHRRKNHHRLACKAGTKRVNGLCKAVVAKKY